MAGLAAIRFPLEEHALAGVLWLKTAGPMGVLTFAAVYVAATLVLIPASLLTVGAGFVFGPLWGTLLVSPVSVFAATVAFALGRTRARPWIQRRVAASPQMAALDTGIEENGLVFVLLLRLSPVFPFGLLNYGLGLTRIRPWEFVLGSFVGMFPATALYVYLGSLANLATGSLGEVSPSTPPFGKALFWGGLAATVALTFFATRMARRAGRHRGQPDSCAVQHQEAGQ